MRLLDLLPVMLFSLLLLAFSSSAVEIWHLGYGWYDQQRIYQLYLILFAVPLAVFLPQQALPRLSCVLLFLIFALGFYSAALAVWWEWALKEWARYLGLVLLALLVGGLGQHRPWFSDAVFWLMATVGGIHAVQFLIYYLAAFVTGIHVLDADILFNGFSNPRFFGQFQVMLLPLVALLLMRCWRRQLIGAAVPLLLVMVVQWCISFILGGRGLWLGLLVAHVFLILVNRSFWRLLALQLMAAVLGCLVYLLLFKLIPYCLELEPVLRDELRSTLSGRELIWRWAWDMALANPWLGAGPMHFSATYNPIAAHPHQVILQWLAEWGVVATGLAVVLGAWGCTYGAIFLRRVNAVERDAALWLAIIGAVVLAQVDGVFVTPYTETWLAILIGLAIARWAKSAPAKGYQRFSCAFFAIPVVLVLGQVLIIEAPALPQSEEAYLIERHYGWSPRFWQQGWIPMDVNRDMTD